LAKKDYYKVIIKKMANIEKVPVLVGINVSNHKMETSL